MGGVRKTNRLHLQAQIGAVIGVKPQHLSCAAFHPLERDGDEREDKTFHPGSGPQSESRTGDKAEKIAVEVVYERSEYHENGVCLHLRTGQVGPIEVVVASSSSAAVAHAVETSFGGRPLVVGLHNLFQTCAVVVCSDAAVEDAGQPAFLVVDLRRFVRQHFQYRVGTAQPITLRFFGNWHESRFASSILAPPVR